MPSSRVARFLIGAACVAVAVLVGTVITKEAKKRYEARAVVWIVQDATAELKAGLRSPV